MSHRFLWLLVIGYWLFQAVSTPAQMLIYARGNNTNGLVSQIQFDATLTISNQNGRRTAVFSDLGGGGGGGSVTWQLDGSTLGTTNTVTVNDTADIDVNGSFGSGKATYTLSLTNQAGVVPGPCGDDTHVCVVTLNQKGIVTAASPTGIAGAAPSTWSTNGVAVGTGDMINFTNAQPQLVSVSASTNASGLHLQINADTGIVTNKSDAAITNSSAVGFVGVGSGLSALNADSITSGTLSSNRLAVTGVTGGTYGSSTQIPVVTIDQYGRISVANTAAAEPTGAATNAVTTIAGSGTTNHGVRVLGFGPQFSHTVNGSNSTITLVTSGWIEAVTASDVGNWLAGSIASSNNCTPVFWTSTTASGDPIKAVGMVSSEAALQSKYGFTTIKVPPWASDWGAHTCMVVSIISSSTGPDTNAVSLRVTNPNGTTYSLENMVSPTANQIASWYLTTNDLPPFVSVGPTNDWSVRLDFKSSRGNTAAVERVKVLWK